MLYSACCSKGNAAFVEENYQEALNYFTQAIEAEASKDEYYANRAQTHIKMENYVDAIADATKAIEISPTNAKAYLRKGIAGFKLGDFQSARDAFTEGHKLDDSNLTFMDWIQKCDSKTPSLEASKVDTGLVEAMADETSASISSQAAAPTAAQIVMPSGPKTSLGERASGSRDPCTVMLKKVKREDFMLDIQERTVGMTVKLPTGTDYSLELDLAHPIVPSQSTHKLLNSKIEVILRKAEGIRWQKLEGDGQESNVKQFNPGASAADDAARRYPSSSHYTRDWDKLVADINNEEKNEKPEGDAALNQLFQQIYQDGTDEVKKAMNKSFVESGGTVLSTNWTDIKTKKTEVKPPDGMEYKNYEF